MKKEKDSRINVGFTSIKEYGLLFFVMAAFNGLHMTIYQRFVETGMLETNVQLVINILMGYVAVTATISMCLVGIVRYVSWSRPMRRIGEAARKIARGDFSARIAPLRKDGKKDAVEVMFDDFNTMAEELSSIETLKSDFIANVSHEIKTPLSVIQGYAAALQNDALPAAERREYTQTIVEASQKLSALISNILKLNKLENQEILPESESYNLDEQLRRCALSFEELWERKNISFDADLDEVSVQYDEAMLELVWNNLLSNAIKFTPSGGSISLGLKVRESSDGEPRSATSAAGSGGKYAAVTLRDSGCGMDGETKKYIFDKFYQGDTSHSREGNGLGLALAKRAVELLGGSISVESEAGFGATFTVSLKI